MSVFLCDRESIRWCTLFTGDNFQDCGTFVFPSETLMGLGKKINNNFSFCELVAKDMFS